MVKHEKVRAELRTFHESGKAIQNAMRPILKIGNVDRSDFLISVRKESDTTRGLESI
jgi:hypothetical protein